VLKIRLRRTGAKKQPAYRVVVADSTAPRDGTFLEILGYYNPLTQPTTFQVDPDRTRQWLERGALPSDRVARLLARSGFSLPARVQPRVPGQAQG
jgi:small subunit ribosomal protein S16